MEDDARVLPLPLDGCEEVTAELAPQADTAPATAIPTKARRKA